MKKLLLSASLCVSILLPIAAQAAVTQATPATHKAPQSSLVAKSKKKSTKTESTMKPKTSTAKPTTDSMKK